MPDGADRSEDVRSGAGTGGRRPPVIERLSRRPARGRATAADRRNVTVGQGSRLEGGSIRSRPSIRKPTSPPLSSNSGCPTEEISTGEVVQAWREEVGVCPTYAASPSAARSSTLAPGGGRAVASGPRSALPGLQTPWSMDSAGWEASMTYARITRRRPRSSNSSCGRKREPRSHTPRPGRAGTGRIFRRRGRSGAARPGRGPGLCAPALR